MWLALAFQALLPMGVMPGPAISGGGLLQLCPSTFPPAVLGVEGSHHHQDSADNAAEPVECEYGLQVPGAAALDVPTAQARAPRVAVSFHPRHASPALHQYNPALARAPPLKHPV